MRRAVFLLAVLGLPLLRFCIRAWPVFGLATPTKFARGMAFRFSEKGNPLILAMVQA